MEGEKEKERKRKEKEIGGARPVALMRASSARCRWSLSCLLRSRMAWSDLSSSFSCLMCASARRSTDRSQSFSSCKHQPISASARNLEFLVPMWICGGYSPPPLSHIASHPMASGSVCIIRLFASLGSVSIIGLATPEQRHAAHSTNHHPMSLDMHNS